MTRYYRIIGVIALCSFIAGCSGYRQVPLRTFGQAPEEDESGYSDELQARDRVRVMLTTGERIEGEIVWRNTVSIAILVETYQNSNGILVGASQDEEGGVQTFPWSDIASIEKYGRKALATGLVTIGAIVVVGAIMALAVFAISMRDFTVFGD